MPSGDSDGEHMIKVIKTDADYEAALREVDRLLDLRPALGTREAEEVELLIVLVKDYESRRFDARLPDPIEAIKFRMDQQNLSRRELVPFIGSRSKVSEVLSRKRPLTLSMIRALHSGLGIPAKVLLQAREETALEQAVFEWERFPLREMATRGWIEEEISDERTQAREVLPRFFSVLGSARVAAALYRRTRRIRSAREMDQYALTAWTAQVMIRALQRSPIKYKPGTINLDFMRALTRLSVFAQGPLLAREHLEKHGVALVVEPALGRTYLDGTAILSESGAPVVGLTLRYDRIDNFWSCLMHELAHVSLHFDGDVRYFYDDLDLQSDRDHHEKEADELAGEALIPAQEWKRSPASRLRSAEAAQHLANKLGIHQAIVAGRIRHYFKSYRVLNQLVGHGEVRRLFREIDWS